MRRIVLLSLISFFFSYSLFSQQTEQAVVPITATIDLSTPSITLDWELDGPTGDLFLIRREKDANTWFIMLDSMGADITSFTDPFVVAGQSYEYRIVRSTAGINAFGYILTSLETPVVDSRGTILVFVEEALQTPLDTELGQLEMDLVGDGWKVNWHTVAPSDSVGSVKSEIIADYTDDPVNVNSVLLLGDIPVPYSGNTNWDGHADHQGAWPADVYYGDVDGVWTDAIINNTTPSRPANDNVPGDGKFDHSIAPTATELAVGRVDFSNLSETTFGTTRVELMRRYLNKNHNWRTKKYTVSNQAMVDDNFGYFGGEAFAANGYRNYYPIVGKDNVMDADFFQDTNTNSYLFGYGCGGGTYTSASGVGNSGNFASDTVNIVFSMLFGSYHGDWDYEDNPFMMSALASEGGILSCSWAGRPHWFYHPMAAGETLGYCALATQNSCDNLGYFGSLGDCGAHVALMGDPSLRAHIVDPISDLIADNKCNAVDLSWSGSSAANLEGYLVFRANALQGDYERLTPDPIMSTSFTDNAPLTGDNYYQVRAIELQTTPSGSYFNASTGVILENNFSAGTPPTVALQAEELTCANQTATVTSTTNAAQPAYSWSGPNGFASNEPSIEVSAIGTYTLTVTDLDTDCSTTESVAVTQDSSLPSATPVAAGNLSCVVMFVQLFANPDMSGYTFLWTGPNNFMSAEENPTVNLAGIYTLTVTSPNGCSSIFSAEVMDNTEIPTANAIGGIITCANPQLMIDGTASSTGPNFAYQWSTTDGNIVSGQNTLTPIVDACGTYTLSIVNTSNGCFAMVSVVVDCDLAVPDVSIDGDFQVLCAGDLVTVTASSITPGVTYFWEGPGITDPTNPTQMLTNGTYILTVTASNGCASTQTLTIAGPAEMTVSLVIVLTDCFGFSQVDANVMGGIPPYTYVFNPMPPYAPNTTFEVIVTDANGCTVSGTGATPNILLLGATIEHTNETIFGANDGTATANPENGIAPFTYLWSNGETTQSIDGLSPGVYTVTITDANGCEAMATVEIEAGAVATEDLIGIHSVELFPNPTSGEATLKISLDQPEMISVEIINIVGQTIGIKQQMFAKEGVFQIDLNTVPQGVYFCNIKIGEGLVSKRLIKL